MTKRKILLAIKEGQDLNEVKRIYPSPEFDDVLDFLMTRGYIEGLDVCRNALNEYMGGGVAKITSRGEEYLNQA